MKDNQEAAATIFRGPALAQPREAPFLAIATNMAGSSLSLNNPVANPPNTYTQTPQRLEQLQDTPLQDQRMSNQIPGFVSTEQMEREAISGVGSELGSPFLPPSIQARMYGASGAASSALRGRNGGGAEDDRIQSAQMFDPNLMIQSGESPLYTRALNDLVSYQEFSESYLNHKLPVSYVDQQDFALIMNSQQAINLSPTSRPTGQDAPLVNYAQNQSIGDQLAQGNSKHKRVLSDEEAQKLHAEARGTDHGALGTGHGLIDGDDQDLEGEGAEGQENDQLMGMDINNMPNYEIEFNFEGFSHQDLIERNLNMQCFLQTYTSKECIVCHPMLQQIYLNALHPERALEQPEQLISEGSSLAYKKFQLNKIIQDNLKKKYMTSKDFYNVKIVNDIIYNEATHIVAVFKDYLIYDDLSEFLKRFYDSGEAITRLPKICEFYERYSKVYPNYVALPAESKIMFKNIERKQKIIDDKQRTLQARMQMREQKMRRKLIKLNGGIVPPEEDLPPLDMDNYESSMSWLKNSQRFFDTKFMDSVLKQDPLPSSNTQHSSFIQKSMLLDRSHLNQPSTSNIINNSHQTHNNTNNYQNYQHNLNPQSAKGRNQIKLKSFAELNLEQLVQVFVSKDYRNDLGHSSILEQQNFTATLDVTMPSFHQQDEADKFLKAMLLQQQQKQKEIIMQKMQQRKNEGAQKLILGNPRPQILSQQQVKLVHQPKSEQTKQPQAITSQSGQKFVFNTNGVNSIIKQQKQFFEKAKTDAKRKNSQGSSIMQNQSPQTQSVLNSSPLKASIKSNGATQQFQSTQSTLPQQTFGSKDAHIIKQFQTQQHQSPQLQQPQSIVLSQNTQALIQKPPSQLSSTLNKQQISTLNQSPLLTNQTSGKSSSIVSGGINQFTPGIIRKDEGPLMSSAAVENKGSNIIKKKVKKNTVGQGLGMATQAGVNLNHHQQPDFKIKHGMSGVPSSIVYNHLAHSQSGALTQRENLQKKLINNLVLNHQPNYQNDFSPLDMQDLTSNPQGHSKKLKVFNYNTNQGQGALIDSGINRMIISQNNHGSQSARVMSNDIKQFNTSKTKQNISLSRESRKTGVGSQLGQNAAGGGSQPRKSSKDYRGIMAGGIVIPGQSSFIPNMKAVSQDRDSSIKYAKGSGSKPAVLQRIDDLIRGESENSKYPTQKSKGRPQSPRYYLEESKQIDISNTLNNQSNHMHSYSNPKSLPQQQMAQKFMSKRNLGKQYSSNQLQDQFSPEGQQLPSAQQQQQLSSTLSHGNSGYNSQHQTNTVYTLQHTDNSQIGMGPNNQQIMKVMQLDIADISTNLNNNSRNFLARQQQQQIQLQKQSRGMNPRQKSVPKNKKQAGANANGAAGGYAQHQQQNMIFIGDPNSNPSIYGAPQLQNQNNVSTNLHLNSGRQSPTTARNTQFNAPQHLIVGDNLLMNSQIIPQQQQMLAPAINAIPTALLNSQNIPGSGIGSALLMNQGAFQHHNSATNRYENGNIVLQNNRQIIKKVLQSSKNYPTPGLNQKSNSQKRTGRGEGSPMDYQVQLLGSTLQHHEMPLNSFATSNQRQKQERQSLDRPAKHGLPYQQQMNLVVDTTVNRDTSKRYSLKASSGPQSTKGQGMILDPQAQQHSGSRVRNSSNQRESNTLQYQQQQQQQQPKKIIIGKKTNIFGPVVAVKRTSNASNL